MIEKNKYLEGISKTGFGLEFSISKSLSSAGWSVINNKYYVDDVQETAREIDILAYKATMKNNLRIYTVLIISCKKSEQHDWVLLAKDINSKDPNADWLPITMWSNDPILSFVLNNEEWKNDLPYSSKLKNKVFTPQKHIFAFQELDKKSGKPKDDKNIFSSIVSTMKSQNYEIESLNKRKTERCIYNFNLISIIDSALFRVNYGKSDPTIQEIKEDIYVGSYIIDKKETVSRVNFITAECFNTFLPFYKELHEHNTKHPPYLRELFYKDCLQDPRKVELLIKIFNRIVRWPIYHKLYELDPTQCGKFETCFIEWDEKQNRAIIILNEIYMIDGMDALNEDQEVVQSIKKALKEVYQYTGSFYIESEIPF